MNNLILDYMEQTAARLPEKTAFADEQTSVAFAALVCRAKKVASALIPLVPPRSVVGFYMDKGVETVVGFMGAVYAGCAYSQLNLRHPAPRVRAMLETLDTPIVVTDRAHLAQLEDINPPARILLIEELEETPLDEDALSVVRAQMIDADPLYVNFTSGSTARRRVWSSATATCASLSPVLRKRLPLRKMTCWPIRRRLTSTYPSRIFTAACSRGRAWKSCRRRISPTRQS